VRIVDDRVRDAVRLEEVVLPPPVLSALMAALIGPALGTWEETARTIWVLQAVADVQVILK